jgi:hypothetical protein
MRNTADQFNNRGLLPNEHDDHKAALRKLIDYHKRIFRLDYFSAAEVAKVKAEITGLPNNIADKVNIKAAELRSIWNGTECHGWEPTKSFMSHLSAELQRIWTAPIQAVRTSALELIACAAAFRPFAIRWQKQLEHEFGVVDAARLGWRTFRAYATWGVSEVIRGAIRIFVDVKEMQAFEKMSTKLSSAITHVTIAREGINTAIENQNALASRLGNGLSLHLMSLLAADYSQLDGARQYALAARFAGIFGDAIPKPSKWTDRGMEGMKWRRRGVVILLAIFVIIIGVSIYLGAH